ncbi:MAG TPA: mechanosensitive ion channel [Bacteroidales bacterium]|nr:mechanosensitive ion channel [Bacteroidales bacterium]HRW95921.1 mechanosensitive ion channel [Bacteroidales bacterium]
MKKYVLLFLVIQLMTFTQSSLASNIPSADTSATELAQGSQEKQTEPTEENNQIKPADALQVISVSKVFWSIVLILIGFLIIKIVIKIMEVIAERSTKLRITIKSLIPIIRIIIWILISFIIIRGIYNPPIETLVAMTASVAIAVGLAAQDLLKNVFGGIMLLFDRPFQVGDKIETSNHYGEVIQIGLRATRIVTPDDSTVSIPNMELMNTAVSNSNTGELNCQVVAEIYLPIDIDTHLVRKIATEAAQVSKYIYLNKPIVVLFFNEIHQRRSYLKMRLKAYVMDIRYEFQFKSDMTEIVIKELLKQKLISRNELL